MGFRSCIGGWCHDEELCKEGFSERGQEMVVGASLGLE